MSDFCQRDANGFCHLAHFCGAHHGGCMVTCEAEADRTREVACEYFARLGRERLLEARKLAEAEKPRSNAA